MEDINYTAKIQEIFDKREKLQQKLRMAAGMNMSQQIVDQMQYTMEALTFEMNDLVMRQQHHGQETPTGDGSLIIGEEDTDE